MANAFMNMDCTTTAEKLVRRAKAFCRLPSTGSGTNFLGSTETAELAELADCVNDAIRDVLDDCPILNIVEAELEATAGAATTALPTTLRHNDILSLEWTYTGYEGRAIRLIPRDEVDRMPDGLKSSDMTLDPPEYCYVGWGDAAPLLYWLPIPSIDRALKVVYRAEATPVTSADVGVEGSYEDAAIVPVPDSMIDLLAVKLAAKIQFRNVGGSGVDWQILEAMYIERLDKWAGILAQSPYAMRIRQGGFAGYPGSRIDGQFSDLQARGYDYTERG